MGWTLAGGLFMFIQAGCAIVSAGLLWMKLKHRESWKPWEDKLMKYAFVVFVISLLACTLLISPYLQFKKSTDAAVMSAEDADKWHRKATELSNQIEVLQKSLANKTTEAEQLAREASLSKNQAHDLQNQIDDLNKRTNELAQVKQPPPQPIQVQLIQPTPERFLTPSPTPIAATPEPTSTTPAPPQAAAAKPITDYGEATYQEIAVKILSVQATDQDTILVLMKIENTSKTQAVRVEININAHGGTVSLTDENGVLMQASRNVSGIALGSGYYGSNIDTYTSLVTSDPRYSSLKRDEYQRMTEIDGDQSTVVSLQFIKDNRRVGKVFRLQCEIITATGNENTPSNIRLRNAVIAGIPTKN